MKHRLVIDATHATDVGQVRARNEDSFTCSKQFFAVADGIGGSPHGDVASNTATTVAKSISFFHSRSPKLATKRVFEEVLKAFQKRRGTEHDMMGTTLTTLAFDDVAEKAVIGSSGDSRCYLLRDGEMRQMTIDQSHGGKLWGGIMTYSSMIMPQMYELKTQPGDIFLLCTDGVTNELTDEEIASLLVSKGVGASGLVRAAARYRYGRDNATAIVVRVREMSDEELRLKKSLKRARKTE